MPTTTISDIQTFEQVRNRSEQICKPLSDEDHVAQPVEFVSPPKWHLGHTTWFFEEFILKQHFTNYEVYSDDFSFLFNSYYNTIGERILRTDRGNLTRPSLTDVLEYRQHVNRNMVRFMDSGVDDEVLPLIQIGLNHEQQHQELLMTDIKYILGHNPLFPAYDDGKGIVNDKNESDKWLHYNEGLYEIGHDGEGFSYDNERPHHKVYLEAYSIKSSLVTNGEYLEFIDDGGYEKHQFWLDDGWTWLQENKVKSPLYWHNLKEGWHQYTFGGLVPIEPNTILTHISHYEAAAFAEWKGLRLPTEAEWEIASPRLDWGKRWEHTSSAYLPYPRFTKPSGAVGEYNGKFMMNQMVLKGASVATSKGHSRPTYRNFFHPHLRWQFCGIRLAKYD